jgi:hypothetical protein
LPSPDESAVMTEPTIQCPKCNTEIKLTESLAAPLIESMRQAYEQQLTEKETDISKRECAIRDAQAAIVKAQEKINEQVEAKLQEQRATIAAEEAKKARQAVSLDLDQKAAEVADLQAVLKERDTKLIEAQKAQAELIRKQRELDDAKREMDLNIEKRVQESLGAVRDKAKLEAEEGLKLRVMEKEQTIASMQKQIEELKRKAEQGSQQLQGEVSELEIENTLRMAFPTDVIEPVPKGEYGGDTLQRICTDNNSACGSILWESKRTKNWSDGWLTKLRNDQRAAKADYAVIVTQTMPKMPDTFDHIDGVWVTCPRLMIPVAICLRQAVLELAIARKAGEGQQTKMELVYQYLTGPRFRHRVQAIVEKFSEMQEDLEKERKTTTRLWAKRESQIRSVVESTAGLYGDLQGIAGRSLQEIECLSIALLTDQIVSNGDKEK